MSALITEREKERERGRERERDRETGGGREKRERGRKRERETEGVHSMRAGLGGQYSFPCFSISLHNDNLQH